MSVLPRKLLLRLSYITIYLINTTILAQPSFISHSCENNNGNFTRNSMYQRNLDTTLSALLTTNNGFGFFNLSTGQGSDRVNSVALCRGDVEPDLCRSYLNDSVVKLRELCPNQKEAIGHYDFLWLKYSNETILGNTPTNGRYLLNGQKTPDRASFIGALRPLINKLIADASAGDSLRKFASGNTTMPDFTTITGLVQCTPDLSQIQCRDCLDISFNQYVIQYGDQIGGRSLQPICNFRYEVYRFFNETTQFTTSFNITTRYFMMHNV